MAPWTVGLEGGGGEWAQCTYKGIPRPRGETGGNMEGE
jgi:hypothetical protein